MIFYENPPEVASNVTGFGLNVKVGGYQWIPCVSEQMWVILFTLASGSGEGNGFVDNRCVVRMNGLHKSIKKLFIDSLKTLVKNNQI